VLDVPEHVGGREPLQLDAAIMFVGSGCVACIVGVLGLQLLVGLLQVDMRLLQRVRGLRQRLLVVMMGWHRGGSWCG
jgi:hypothetical protein